jgi:hypothetical protein
MLFTLISGFNGLATPPFPDLYSQISKTKQQPITFPGLVQALAIVYME